MGIFRLVTSNAIIVPNPLVRVGWILDIVGKDIAFRGLKHRGAVFACQGIFCIEKQGLAMRLGAVAGVDAKDLLGRGIRSTLAFKRFIQEELEREKDPDAVAHGMARDWLDKSGFTFLPDEVMFYISRGMIKNALQEKVD